MTSGKRGGRRWPLAVLVAVALHCLVLCHASSNDGSSGDSDSSTSQDYDDAGYDDVGAADDAAAEEAESWYADDPYYPTDDYVLRQRYYEVTSARNEAAAAAARPAAPALPARISLGAAAVLGWAGALCCTAMTLYFARVAALLRRYEEDGAVVVEGRVVASAPDLREEMTRQRRSEEKEKAAEKMPHPDSYSMMTDEDSCLTSRSGGSGSDASGLDTAAETDVEEGTKSAARARRGAAAAARARRRGTALHRAIVEYDDVTYHDVISQKSSHFVRKRLWVHGADVLPAAPGADAELRVRLRVLPGRPTSGRPYGAVRRERAGPRRRALPVYLLAGAILVAGGAWAAYRVLPAAWFRAYLGALLLQAPALHALLDGAFARVLEEEYLGNGVRLPVAQRTTRGEAQERMVLALAQGTSFG